VSSALVRTLRPALAAVVLAVAGLAASAAPAKAASFAMITIDNPTDSTVSYQFKWGNGDWEDFSLAPGHYRNHWYPLDEDGRAPTPQIRFDDGHGNVVAYRLEFYASETRGYDQGKIYYFRWVYAPLVDGYYLDLFAK
jgi:hypothetical protein